MTSFSRNFPHASSNILIKSHGRVLRCPTPHSGREVSVWITDTNDNQASVEYFGSEEKARAALATLVDCKDCTNCVGCTGCTMCVRCVDCISCTNCILCKNCSNCIKCSDCIKCQYCTHCYDCKSCIQTDYMRRVKQLEITSFTPISTSISGEIRNFKIQFTDGKKYDGYNHPNGEVSMIVYSVRHGRTVKSVAPIRGRRLTITESALAVGFEIRAQNV